MSWTCPEISALATLLLVGAFSTEAPAQSSARPARGSDEPTPIASNRSGETTTARIPASTLAPILASPRLEGIPSPGLRVTLDATSSSGGRMWYRWLQTQGPKVTIEGPTSAEAAFTVPPDATTLGFVLVVGNASGVDAKALTVEVDDPEREADEQSLKADAGDEQAARVGRRVVLNATRSEPKGKVRYRWVQAGGPKATLKANDSAMASFVPGSPGTYQFALVVSTPSGVMSDPSVVSINVGGNGRASADASTMAIDELARASLVTIEGGAGYADSLAKAFDASADAVDSVRTFAEIISETTRRLDSVVPREPERRAIWIEQLFAPLMAKVAAVMKGDGLDLTKEGAQTKPLSRSQRAKLAEQLRYAAAGLRASKTLR